jgi:glycosyltransferase involved in cell wall biosynthesis
MNQVKVSIVIPCYNQAIYLMDCISSVTRQTYTNWECIVVNDGSTDHFNDLVESLTSCDTRILAFSKLNGGLSSARNYGIQKATGKYILPLDADDMIGPEYLKLCVGHLEETNDVKLVYGRAIKFGLENGAWNLRDYFFKDLLVRNMIFCTAMYAKSEWERIGGYDEGMKMGWEDWEYWIRLLSNGGSVIRENGTLFYYRTKPTSMIKELISRKDHSLSIREYVFQKHCLIYSKYFDFENFQDFSNKHYR